MATKETITELVKLMASTWTFPGKDLVMTAAAYHLALRELSDEEVKGAVTELLSSWAKTTPPKPADITAIVRETRPVSSKPLRLPPRERSHEDIMHKIRCDTYASAAVIEILGEHKPFEKWTEDQKRAVAKRQQEYREELGL